MLGQEFRGGGLSLLLKLGPLHVFEEEPLYFMCAWVIEPRLPGVTSFVLVL